MSFYAYIHCKPDGMPFYVGKGSENRTKRVQRKANNWHCNIVNKYGEKNILVGKIECFSEQIAFDLEIGLIKRLRAMQIHLVNMTSGGGGASGFCLSDEAKEKKRQALLGRPRSEETKEKLRLANLGKKHTEESRKKMSKIQKNKIVSLETRKKISEAHKGKIVSPETKRKISELAKGRKTFLGKEHKLESKIKISRSQGGLPVECIRGNDVLFFDTLKEAITSLGISKTQAYRHLKNKNGAGLRPVSGWMIRRIRDGG